MTLTTSPISAETSPSLSTVAVVASAIVTGCAATCAASSRSARSRGGAPISSAPAATVGHVREHLLRGAGRPPGLRRGLLRRGGDLRRGRRQLLRRGRHRIRGGHDPATAGARSARHVGAAIWPTSSPQRDPQPSTVRSAGQSPPASCLTRAVGPAMHDRRSAAHGRRSAQPTSATRTRTAPGDLARGHPRLDCPARPAGARLAAPTRRRSSRWRTRSRRTRAAAHAPGAAAPDRGDRRRS